MLPARLATLLTRQRLLPLLAGVLSLVVFLPGINWGLPSRADDAFLFGERTPWSGQEIIDLAGGLDADSGRGADVDANPLDRSGGPIVLNDTDARRAETVRRYRLMSHQPDEFINFKAIAGMAQRRDGDPRLYQYGGLWIYPVAGLLGVAHVVDYVELRGDMAWYLDRPEAFGRFYVVARLYSALWGVVGTALVFVIVRRLTGGGFAPMCAAVAFALLPVVVTGAHEAKPHLAGAVLMLAAVLKADDFVQTSRRRDAVWAGVLCGAASAMVVSMVVAFAVLPVMAMLRARRDRHARERAGGESSSPDLRAWLSALMALGAGVVVYAATNPWVIHHLLFDRDIFRSNISNSTAMYPAGDLVGGAASGVVLLALAVGTLFFFAIVFAGAVLLARRVRLGARSWLLLTAAAAVLIYFLPLGAGKPPEYARFGIVPMTVLLIAYFAVAGRGLTPLPARRRLICLLGTILVALAGVPYVVNFVADARPDDTRTRAARRIAERLEGGATSLDLWAEPAPWSIPPFDLWAWQAVLNAEEGGAPDVRVEAVDAPISPEAITGPFITPVSWASKPFMIIDRTADAQ